MIARELERLKRAFGYSLDGLKAAWESEPAFRVEVFTAIAMFPLAMYLGETNVGQALLVGSLILVLIVEVLNSAIEHALDRISTDPHPLTKIAKDMGSAAVLLALVNAGVIWLIFIF